MPHPPTPHIIGSPFIELQSVDSTNNYARQQILASSMTERSERQTGRQLLALHGMAIFAHEQTAGKGQRGKSWASEKGTNIMLSIILNPQPLLISQQFQLSACVALAIHDFFRRYAGDDTKIKWPNDLYWQNRKAGGILIESIVGSREAGGGSWDCAVAGIGININQTIFPEDLPNPVSLKQITGRHFDPAVLAKELCTVINEKYSLLLHDGFESIYEQYLRCLYMKDNLVKFRKGSRVFEAVVKKVSPVGRLVVQHAVEEEFDFGEVEWLIN